MNLGKAHIRLDVDDEGELLLVLVQGESWELDVNELVCEQVIADPDMREHYEEALGRLYWRTHKAAG